jgi:hypothetical protein
VSVRTHIVTLEAADGLGKGTVNIGAAVCNFNEGRVGAALANFRPSLKLQTAAPILTVPFPNPSAASSVVVMMRSVMRKGTVNIGAAVCNFNEGRVGAALANFAAWWMEGIADALSNAMCPFVLI